MWVYSQCTGILYSPGGKVEGLGYSGFGAGKNNMGMENAPNVGPIPQGGYDISDPFDSETKGPVVMRLTPWPDTLTFGRTGFLIHGDLLDHPGCASHGCVILSRQMRLSISQSGDKKFYVQA